VNNGLIDVIDACGEAVNQARNFKSISLRLAHPLQEYSFAKTAGEKKEMTKKSLPRSLP